MARKTITELVLNRKKQLNANDPSGPIAAAENQRLAQAAIIGGIKSNEWKTYMLQFVDDDPATGAPFADQLSRLLGTDNNADPALNKARAYLVSNGMCGDWTRKHFEETVQGIDSGL
jgi:hypothetical protein